MKLIKLSPDHYIIVSESEIKEGDIFIHPDNVIERASRDLDGRGISKIIASTNKLNGVIFLNLSEVKELIGEVDVEKKAYDYVNKKDFSDDAFRGYKAGYNQALEDNKGKVFTEKDMIRAYRQGGNNGAAFEAICQNDYNDAKRFEKANDEKFMASLQPSTSWDIEFVNGKLKLK